MISVLVDVEPHVLLRLDFPVGDEAYGCACFHTRARRESWVVTCRDNPRQ